MSQPESSTQPHRVAQTTNRPRAVQWTCYAALGVVLAGALLIRLPRPFEVVAQVDPVRASQVQQRIDPNSASWAELARLPGIGRTLAQRIVAYRQARRAERDPPAASAAVFARPEDLEAIPGIGPKTVAGLAGHLALPASEPERAH